MDFEMPLNYMKTFDAKDIERLVDSFIRDSNMESASTMGDLLNGMLSSLAHDTGDDVMKIDEKLSEVVDAGIILKAVKYLYIDITQSRMRNRKLMALVNAFLDRIDSENFHTLMQLASRLFCPENCEIAQYIVDNFSFRRLQRK